MENHLRYTIDRRNRKTFSISVNPDGSLVIKAPLAATDSDVDAVIQKKLGWIQKTQKHLREMEKQTAQIDPLSIEELRVLAEDALRVIPNRVRYYAPKVGVTYGRVTIRNQRTKWGSCSSAGNLNFNCLLMLAPPEVLDSVVVHELCHRKEMNHSDRFYAEVLRVFPEYPTWNRWLKEHGHELMCRMPR